MEKEKKKLKDKIGFRIAMVVFVACCVAVIFLTLYLFNGEIVSNVPDWFEDSYAVETEKIERRKVFIIKKDKETDYYFVSSWGFLYGRTKARALVIF